MLRVCLGACCLVIVACASAAQSSPDEIVLLTRDGCVNTATMRQRLDAALQALGRSTRYTVIDADSLSETDPRGGYGTPTVLVGNVDLFGLLEPPVPHPPAT